MRREVLDDSAVSAVATGLRQVGAGGVAALDRLGRLGVDAWTGPAADAFGSAVEVLVADVLVAHRAAEDAAAAISAYAADLLEADALGVRAGEVAARAETARVRWTATGSAGADPGFELYARSRRMATEADARVAAADERLRHRLDAVDDRVVRHHLDGADQWREGLAAFADGLVVAPTALLWGLSGDGFRDGGAASSTWRGLASSAADTVRHPVETAEGVVGWDDLRSGHQGRALGVLSAGVVSVGVKRFAKPLLPDGRPAGQTVDDFLRSVDLDHHEESKHGHTLERHVHITEQGVVDRLLHDRQRVAGSRKDPDSVVRGRFTSRDEAERQLALAVSHHEDAIRQWAASGQRESLVLEEVDADPPLGAIARVGASGEVEWRAGDSITVVLLSTRSGRVQLMTAYPTVRKW